ncbi:hypothetical protein KKA53_00930 [Candidatus Dependentiae bacterium]|nr:hypothetical protein [Candidatus Dependentiae bacterium]
MQLSGIWCNEYESGYDSDYGSIYDQCFVFYDDEEEVDDEASYDDDYEYDDLDSDLDDFILEEIPFVHCPSKGETGEA